MGTYGYQPYQNDDAADAWLDIAESVGAQVEDLFKKTRGLTPQQRWTRLGVLTLLFQAPRPFQEGQSLRAMKAAREDIRILLESEAWLKAWDEPGKACDALKKLDKKLQKKIAETTEKMKRYAKAHAKSRRGTSRRKGSTSRR